ncbi:MAG: SurA N-terminal domain-containing protein [Buchnera aphidicola (Floraphis meitanensis)]
MTIKKKIKLIISNIIILIFLVIIFFSLVITKINFYSLINKKNYIIKINNEKINLNDFIKIYTIELLKYKKNIDLNNLKSLQNRIYLKKIYKKVMLNIIYETLLKQYIKKLNIFAKSSEIKNYIHNQSIFKENNIFSIKKYYSFLNSINMNSNEYINKIETNLKINKFISFISNSTFVLKNEMENLIQLLSQVRMIKIAPIKISNIFKYLIDNNRNIKIHHIQHNRNILFLSKKNTLNPFIITKKIIYELNHGSNKILKQMNIKFEKKQFFYKFDLNKLEKLIFNLPHPTYKKNIYFSILKNNHDLLLVQFYKIKYIKFSKKQKNIIFSRLLKHNIETILNSIINNLYTKANISYGRELTNLNQYF